MLAGFSYEFSHNLEKKTIDYVEFFEEFLNKLFNFEM